MRGAVLRYESRIQAMVPQTQTVGSTASSCCVVWSDPRRALPSRHWMDFLYCQRWREKSPQQVRERWRWRVHTLRLVYPDPYLQAGSSMVFFFLPFRSMVALRRRGARQRHTGFLAEGPREGEKGDRRKKGNGATRSSGGAAQQKVPPLTWPGGSASIMSKEQKT